MHGGFVSAVPDALTSWGLAALKGLLTPRHRKLRDWECALQMQPDPPRAHARPPTWGQVMLQSQPE